MNELCRTSLNVGGQFASEPCREKTCLQGFRKAHTQTTLLSYRD